MTGGGWWSIGVGLTIFAWAFYCDVKLDTSGHLARWSVKRLRRLESGVSVLAFAVSLGALAGYAAAVTASGYLAHTAGNPLWALLIAYPAMLGYAPFVYITTPVPYGGYGWRWDLSRAGADLALQRRIAWSAGPPSLLGFCAIIATCAIVFLA